MTPYRCLQIVPFGKGEIAPASLFYEGGIAAHIVNIEVLVGSHVGLAEHGDIIETVDLELEKLAALEDKLASLKRHFK